MRLLLDADLSHRRLGVPLERHGHDVVSLQADPARRSYADERVLEFAAEHRRILVSRNARHFGPLARAWADGGQSHAGIVLIWTLVTNEFAAILAELERLFSERPRADAWRDIVLAI